MGGKGRVLKAFPIRGSTSDIGISLVSDIAKGSIPLDGRQRIGEMLLRSCRQKICMPKANDF